MGREGLIFNRIRLQIRHNYPASLATNWTIWVVGCPGDLTERAGFTCLIVSNLTINQESLGMIGMKACGFINTNWIK
jgi:hypothetical protein